MRKGSAAFSFFFCVFRTLLCRRQSGAEMVAGVGGAGGGGQRSGHGGRPESIGSVMRWLCAR